MNPLRRWAARSPLRRVLLDRRVRRVVASVLALRFLPALWVVDRPVAFAAAELRREGTREYRLRRSGAPLVVRHGQGALELVHEIFRAGCYDPPTGLATLVGPRPRILDLGANVGVFTAFARDRWPNSDIVMIEADPDNVAVLERYLELAAVDGVELVAAAASVSDEPVHFKAGHGAGSRIATTGPLCDAVDVLPLIARADLIKLDIEGGEWPILADPRMASTGPLVLVMEYHGYGTGDRPPLELATELLTGAGFRVGHERPNYWGHGTLWAWRA